MSAITGVTTAPEPMLVTRAHRRLDEFRARGVAYIILLPHGQLRFWGRGYLHQALAAAKRYGNAYVLETCAPSTREAITQWALECERHTSKGSN